MSCNLLSYFRRSPSPRGFGGMATSSPLGDHDTLTPPNSKCATPTRSLSPSSPLLDSTFSILGDPDSIVTQITLINGEKILVREELSSTSTSQLGSRFGSNLCSPSPWLKDRPTVSEPIDMPHGANTIGSTTRYCQLFLHIFSYYIYYQGCPDQNNTYSLFNYSEDCNSSTDSLNISAPLYVQTNFDCSMSTMSNDDATSSLNGGISGMMSDVDNGISLSSTTDEIQDHSGMMDFQTLLQQLPTSSAPQNVRILCK